MDEPKLDKKQLGDKILKMLAEEKASDVLELVQTSYRDVDLSAKPLGELFLAYLDVVGGWEDEDEKISQSIKIDDLCQINKSFKTENGCMWAADDRNLGKTYLIERKQKDGRVYSVKLVGFNNSNKKHRTIRSDIKKEIGSQRCVVLDVGTRIEVDHKNGRYDDEIVANPKTQQLSDFQPMHKSVNDAKRQHCKECVINKKRYNAQRLGYKEGWIFGNADDTVCKGCYWYDPKEFNKTISQDFQKDIAFDTQLGTTKIFESFKLQENEQLSESQFKT